MNRYDDDPIYLRNTWVDYVFETLKTIFIAVVIAGLITTFIFTLAQVDGSSMEPTLHHGDKLFILRPKLPGVNVDYGDIVITDMTNIDGTEEIQPTSKSLNPMNNRVFFIKRLIGKEGDIIRIQDGILYRNNEEVTEPYVIEGIPTLSPLEGQDIVVGPGQVFIVGDNRYPEMSYDSRYFGPIESDRVRGKAVLRIYPFNKFGKIENNTVDSIRLADTEVQ